MRDIAWTRISSGSLSLSVELKNRLTSFQEGCVNKCRPRDRTGRTMPFAISGGHRPLIAVWSKNARRAPQALLSANGDHPRLFCQAAYSSRSFTEADDRLECPSKNHVKNAR